MKRRFLYALCAAIVGIASNAHAHLYWIEPNEFYFYDKSKQMDKKVSQYLTFEFTGGDTYFNADINRAKDEPNAYPFRILDNKNQEVKASDVWHGKTRAIFESGITQPGTYVIETARTSPPMYFTKMKSGEYIRKSADELTSDEQNNAVQSYGYYQATKSYITLHKPNDTWKHVLGHNLEIVPLSHPNTIYEGDSLRVKLLYKGKPLANATINAIHQGFRFKTHGEVPISAVTDAEGIATITFPSSNRYLLSTEHKVPLKDNVKAEGLSYKASLMLEVNAPWVKQWEQ